MVSARVADEIGTRPHQSNRLEPGGPARDEGCPWLMGIVDQLESYPAVRFGVDVDRAPLSPRRVLRSRLRRRRAAGGHQLDGLVHVSDVHAQMVELPAVPGHEYHLDVEAGNLLDPLEGMPDARSLSQPQVPLGSARLTWVGTRRAKSSREAAGTPRAYGSGLQSGSRWAPSALPCPSRPIPPRVDTS